MGCTFQESFIIYGVVLGCLPDLTRHASCKTTSSKKSTAPKFYKTWEKGGKGDQLNSSINVLSKEVRFSVGY